MFSPIKLALSITASFFYAHQDSERQVPKTLFWSSRPCNQIQPAFYRLPVGVMQLFHQLLRWLFHQLPFIDLGCWDIATLLDKGGLHHNGNFLKEVFKQLLCKHRVIILFNLLNLCMIFTAVIFMAQNFEAVTVNSVTHCTFVLFSRMTGMYFYAVLTDADRSVLLFYIYSSQWWSTLHQYFNAC